MRALMKNPDERFASAGEMKAAMFGSQAPPPPVHERAADDEAEDDAGAGGAKRQQAAAGPVFGRDDDYFYGHGIRPENARPGAFVLPEVEDTPGRFMRRWARRAAVLCIGAAAIAIPALYFRGGFDDTISGVQSRMEDGQAAGRQEGHQPQESGRAHGAYRATIMSAPAGAAVYDAHGSDGKGRLLGRTPLDTTFLNWENALILTKPGYSPARIVVTRAQPVQSVALKPLAKQPAPENAAGAIVEGAKPAGDGEGPSATPAASAEPEGQATQQ
jgi:hypothetical protein